MAAAPPVVPSAVFTGIVKQVVDARTLLVARDAPAPSSLSPHHRTDEESIVPILLYGVAPPPAESAADAGARKFLGQMIGKRVRIAVRQGTRETPRAVRGALVYLLPDTGGRSGMVDAPPPPAEQKAPPVVLVPTRAPEATGTAPDLPKGGPDRPNVPTASNIPVPPAAGAVRANDCVNYAMVRQGFGQWDRGAAPLTVDGAPFADAQKDAQRARRGMWAAARGGSSSR